MVGLILAIGLGIAFGLGYFPGIAPGHKPLVVYCAHDSIYAESILREFERQTGIRVAPRFDAEATKSLGLVNLLLQEKEQPRCDVFWNNEALGTLDLKRQGVLISYKGPGFERMPATYKDPEGFWVGFGARMRVAIVNTQKMAATEAAVQEALEGNLSRMAIAVPLYGTTLTHYSVLWHLWGAERLKEWHHDLRSRGVQEAAGNAPVKNLVAAGTCDFGWTDTDDFFIAKDDGRPVAVLPVKVDEGMTICVPNTVAIIKGTQQLEAAQRLVDFLLSAETELALAKSKARQIPLGPVAPEKLPEEVRQLTEWVTPGVDLAELYQARTECLAWLKSEYFQ